MSDNKFCRVQGEKTSKGSKISKSFDIIATLTIVEKTPDIIDRLLSRGISSFRFTVGRNRPSAIAEHVDVCRKASERACVKCKILLDIPYPKAKVRIIDLGSSIRNISAGERVVFVNSCVPKRPEGSINLDYGHPFGLHVGDVLIHADDFGELIVESVSENQFTAVARDDFVMYDRKSLSINSLIPMEDNRQNLEDILSLINDANPDILALSFCETAEEIESFRKHIKKNGHIQIMAKIETDEGVRNIDELSRSADSIMVARGDLGITAPLYKAGVYQKIICSTAKINGKDVYVATDILSSYMYRSRPSRSDIYDLTQIVMDDVTGIIIPGYLCNHKKLDDIISLIHNVVDFSINSVIEPK